MWVCVMALGATSLVGCYDSTFDEIPELYNHTGGGGDGDTDPLDPGGDIDTILFTSNSNLINGTLEGLTD